MKRLFQAFSFVLGIVGLHPPVFASDVAYPLVSFSPAADPVCTDCFVSGTAYPRVPTDKESAALQAREDAVFQHRIDAVIPIECRGKAYPLRQSDACLETLEHERAKRGEAPDEENLTAAPAYPLVPSPALVEELRLIDDARFRSHAESRLQTECHAKAYPLTESTACSRERETLELDMRVEQGDFLIRTP